MPEHDTSALAQTYFRAAMLVLALNVISAILFIALVRRPVYDDVYNITDVRAYAVDGISTATIREQRNAPGPGSFIWMSFAVRLLRGDELRDARIAALLSWIFLGFIVVLGARRSARPQLWYGALLAALVFPHAATASATVLTEGPGLLFALAGALAWIEWASREGPLNFASPAPGLAAALSMGVSIACRQYYLALLPAAGVLALLLLRDRAADRKISWFAGICISLAVALLPVLPMLLIWHGVTSPGIESGASYSNFHASVGINWTRPLVVVFYIALYLLPFSFPAMLRTATRRRALCTACALISLVIALIATHFREDLLNPGPLNSLIAGAAHIRGGAALLFFLIVAVTTFNFLALVSELWLERSRWRSALPATFSGLLILFFIGEQFGVGGNVPFYDRYVLQLAPFLGLLGFWLFPKFTRGRILALVALLSLSQFMLWRYAFLK